MLEGSSTISQLQESKRLNIPNILFLCETKQIRSFVEKVMNNLQFRDRWDASEPGGMRGGLLVAWTQNVDIKQIRKKYFLCGTEGWL